MQQAVSRSAILISQVVASPFVIIKVIYKVSSCASVGGVIKSLTIILAIFHPINPCLCTSNLSKETIFLSTFEFSKLLSKPITISMIIITPIDIVQLIPPIILTWTITLWCTLNAFRVSRIHIRFQDLKVWISHQQLESVMTTTGISISCLELNKIVTREINISFREWSCELFTITCQILAQTANELRRWLIG